jgi:hypothetical protein
LASCTSILSTCLYVFGFVFVYCCFTAALCVLFSFFLGHGTHNIMHYFSRIIMRAMANIMRFVAMRALLRHCCCVTAALLLLLYCCFTAAVLLLYCCFTAALLRINDSRGTFFFPRVSGQVGGAAGGVLDTGRVRRQ